MENVGVGSVVDKDHRVEISVDNPEILCVYVLVDFYAVFAVETVPDVLSFWVELVKDNICVGFVAGREGNDFVVFRHSFEEADGVGPDGDVGVSCRPVFDLDRKGEVVGLGRILLAVEDGLVDVNQQGFFVVVVLVAR